MILLRCIIVGLLMLPANFVAANKADLFPHRLVYSDVPVIEVAKLRDNYESYLIIDVRSKFEFGVLHMLNARNVPMSNSRFETDVIHVRTRGRPIVVYCNGHACEKSYKAARRLIAAGLNNVWAFDTGILDWFKQVPAKTVLLGRHPAQLEALILEHEFQYRLLDAETFFAGAALKGSLLIDIREPVQRVGTKAISGSQQIPIDKFIKVLNSGRLTGYTLYIVDAVAKQVRWLQYYFKQAGFDHYYFLKGGAQGL